MAYMTLFFLLCIPLLAAGHNDRRAAQSLPWLGKRASPPRNVPAAGYYNPIDSGGNMLAKVPGTSPPQGEPLNAIVSGNSDEAVLVDAETSGGLRNYFLSVGFAGECLGQHEGASQTADLGDGHGYLNESAVIRWDYGDPSVGTCKETIQGGNHFRYWVQNGPQGNSGAVFMATSSEKPISQGHDIVPNGYNFGRDYLVGNITNQAIPTSSLVNSSTFSGSTSFGGYTYATTVEYVAGMLQNTSIGINHNNTVPLNGANAIDGLVAVLTVKITSQPTPPPTNTGWRSIPTTPVLYLFPSAVVVLSSLMILL